MKCSLPLIGRRGSQRLRDLARAQLRGALHIPDQAQVGLTHQGGRLQGVSGPLPAHQPPRVGAQLFVEQVEDLGAGFGIAHGQALQQGAGQAARLARVKIVRVGRAELLLLNAEGCAVAGLGVRLVQLGGQFGLQLALLGSQQSLFARIHGIHALGASQPLARRRKRGLCATRLRGGLGNPHGF